MTIQDFKKELNSVVKVLEKDFKDYYFEIISYNDEIILKCNYCSFRLRIFFKTTHIKENSSSFYFDISTSYTFVNYISGIIFYDKLIKELEKVLKFFDSFTEYYN